MEAGVASTPTKTKNKAKRTTITSANFKCARKPIDNKDSSFRVADDADDVVGFLSFLRSF